MQKILLFLTIIASVSLTGYAKKPNILLYDMRYSSMQEIVKNGNQVTACLNQNLHLRTRHEGRFEKGDNLGPQELFMTPWRPFSFFDEKAVNPFGN